MYYLIRKCAIHIIELYKEYNLSIYAEWVELEGSVLTEVRSKVQKLIGYYSSYNN